MKSTRFYHGTKSEAAAESIVLMETNSSTPQWSATLPDAHAIVDYIASIAAGYMDYEMMVEYFRGAQAVLRMVPVGSLEEGHADANVPSKAKERKYLKLDTVTMPPLVVEGGTILDGNHRFRVAVKLGLTEVPCYVIEDVSGD